MKILYIITTSEHGGATKNAFYIARHFARRHEVLFVAGDSLWVPTEAQAAGFRFMCIPEIVKPLNAIKDIQATVKVWRLMRDWKPDIVHCHSSKTGLIGRLCARLLGIPVVFSAHGWSTLFAYGKLRTLLYYCIEKLTVPFANAMICVSSGDYEYSVKTFAVKRIVKIFNGLPDNGLVRANGATSSKRLRLVSVARFAAPKTPGLIVDALKQVRAEGLDYSLTFIGSGPQYEYYQDYVASQQLTDAVEFLGEREDVDELLVNYDVFILSSRWEGLPVSIIEALRTGLPVICSDVGGARDLVIDGDNGLLVPRDDSAAIAEALRRAYSDRKWLAAAAAASRRRYLECFSDERMYSGVEQLYRELIINFDDEVK